MTIRSEAQNSWKVQMNKVNYRADAKFAKQRKIREYVYANSKNHKTFKKWCVFLEHDRQKD